MRALGAQFGRTIGANAVDDLQALGNLQGANHRKCRCYGYDNPLTDGRAAGR